MLVKIKGEEGVASTSEEEISLVQGFLGGRPSFSLQSAGHRKQGISRKEVVRQVVAEGTPI